MRYVLENVEAGKLAVEVKRHGIPADQRLRVVLETLDDAPALARIAEEGGAFGFLAEEPDIYSEADIRPA
jgi:hypothetical protein